MTLSDKQEAARLMPSSLLFPVRVFGRCGRVIPRRPTRRSGGAGGYDSVAVVGSIIRRTSVTLFAGKPLRRACSWMIASSLAR
jgi:hypothetical protein